MAYCVANNMPLVIEDAYNCEFFNKNVDKLNNYRTRSIICMPIVDQFNKVIGAC